MHKNNELLDEHPREFWEKQILQWVRDEKARYAITRNFLDGVPYEDIATELNISRTTVYKKVSEYSKILFKHI